MDEATHTTSAGNQGTLGAELSMTKVKGKLKEVMRQKAVSRKQPWEQTAVPFG